MNTRSKALYTALVVVALVGLMFGWADWHGSVGGWMDSMGDTLATVVILLGCWLIMGIWEF